MQSEIHPIINEAINKDENPTKQQYFAIHYCRDNNYNQVQSDLGEAVRAHFKALTKNTSREIVVPNDFMFFKGYDGKAQVVSDIIWPYIIPYDSESN